MKTLYLDHLFEKHMLVATRDHARIHPSEVIFSLAALFNIRITDGGKLAQEEMIPYVSEKLGVHVPEPFYRGFPESVRTLSTEQLLVDQLLHYALTYGLGIFEGDAGHSLFESVLERTAFREQAEIRDFSIITEEKAEEKIAESVSDLLNSTRPLSDVQYALVLEYLRDHPGEVDHCASKQTAVRLLSDSRNMRLAKFLSLSDVIRLVEEIHYRSYGNEQIRDLNLRNQDRKFITKVINQLIDAHRCDLETCFEKKAVWCGLLHHLHYTPHSELSAHFVECMRGNENLSVYARFEKAMEEKKIQKAAEILREGKGSAAVLRHLNYLLSRCGTDAEAETVLNAVESTNIIVLLQMLLQYAGYQPTKEARDFIFTRFNRLKVHHETDSEVSRRRSVLPEAYADRAAQRIRENLRELLRGRLGKVYIEPRMYSIALPMQENTSQGGYGVLARGSRIRLPEGKKIRAFTYWEKVNDIDLSVIGLDEEKRQTEFSWRTMAGQQSSGITYSGDQTNGYNGGSEFFDLDPEAFRRIHPEIRHLVFCNNVFSGTDFNECLCRAGYMVRDVEDSGEVFEPQTVQSSYVIDCASTFAYLFALDLETNEFIWLNTARQSNERVAGATSLDFLTRYFGVTRVVNMATFFEQMAEEVVQDPSEAEVIVSDRTEDAREGAEVIRSCDFEKVLAYMNAKPAGAAAPEAEA